MSWRIALGVLVTIAVVYAVLLAALLYAAKRVGSRVSLRDAVRLVPDVVRMLRRVIADSSVPRSVRVAVVALIAYLVSPIDLVPDFIPVIGFADDILLVALVLHFVARRAGAETLEGHWPGSPETFAVVRRLSGGR